MHTPEVIHFLFTHWRLGYDAASIALAKQLGIPAEDVVVAGTYVLVRDRVFNIPRKLILLLASASKK